MKACDVIVLVLAKSRVHREGKALLPAGSWPRARSLTTWSHRVSLCLAQVQDECLKKVRRHRRTVQRQASRSRSDIAVLVTAATNLQTGDHRLLKKTDRAVYRVLAGLPVHQPRNPPQLTG